jgi:hypothetical protein
VLDESWWCFDRVHTAPVRYDELFKLGEKMTSPSVGCVNDGFGTNTSSSRLDINPAFGISLHNFNDWCVRMQRQVACLEKNAKKSVDKFVRPSETCQILYAWRVRRLTFVQKGALLLREPPSFA